MISETIPPFANPLGYDSARRWHICQPADRVSDPDSYLQERVVEREEIIERCEAAGRGAPLGVEELLELAALCLGPSGEGAGWSRGMVETLGAAVERGDRPYHVTPPPWREPSDAVWEDPEQAFVTASCIYGIELLEVVSVRSPARRALKLWTKPRERTVAEVRELAAISLGPGYGGEDPEEAQEAEGGELEALEVTAAGLLSSLSGMDFAWVSSDLGEIARKLYPDSRFSGTPSVVAGAARLIDGGGFAAVSEVDGVRVFAALQNDMPPIIEAVGAAIRAEYGDGVGPSGEGELVLGRALRRTLLLRWLAEKGQASWAR